MSGKINATLYTLRPLLIALPLTYLVYRLAGWFLRKVGKPAQRRIEAFVGQDATESVVFGSKAHRVRTAFAELGLSVAGWEGMAVWLGRLTGGLAAVMLLWMLGLPSLAAALGFPAGAVAFDAWLDERWRKMRLQVEEEIPALLVRLAAAVKVTENVPLVLSEVAETLSPKGPLRRWLLRLLKNMQTQGPTVALQQAREEAQILSPSLLVVVALLERFVETGGQGFVEAFDAAAANLSDVLDARVNARNKGASAQGTVFIIAGVTLLMMVSMLHSGLTMGTGIQALFGVVILWMTVGMMVVRRMIQEAI